MTQNLEAETKIRKIGKSCARYTVSNESEEDWRWATAKRTFEPPLDLSAYNALGFWLHGDTRGGRLDVRLRDDTSPWHEMGTELNFTGWRYVEFPLGGAPLDRSRIKDLMIVYAGVHAKRTLSCCVDDIRVLKQTSGLRYPALAIGDQRIGFPVTMAEGDRIVLRADGSCRHCSGEEGVSQRIKPVWGISRFPDSPCPVRLAFSKGSPADLRVRVSLGRVLR